MHWRKLLPVALGLAVAGCAGNGARPASDSAAAAQIREQAFGSKGRRSVKALVYVLHRDERTAEADDNHRFARDLVAAAPGVRVVALTQPFPQDDVGTAGRGFGRDRVASFADRIEAGRRRYPDVPTLVVGDGVGAALAADLTGLRPKLVDGMVLAACPCMLPEWRKHMEKQTAATWRTPASDSLDPLMTVGGVRPQTKAALLVGSDDPITPPKFSRGYAEALVLRGIATDFRVLPGRGNDILSDPEVLSATTRMLTALQAPR
ncbi:alpha/beta hydrolase [Sphingomonas sp. PL-96]|uniref:alpha/beta hydrolase n=1 Tax=Sphingomonas sp. PL-96 TaxID=2887201 RepID=UPI001E533283|nr:alpha/beta hydrolase [Sphingomonas sp. PL-96]MCC2976323.1 alpha/beta hydrolase [Sphingomonas sp. PL-96]